MIVPFEGENVPLGIEKNGCFNESVSDCGIVLVLFLIFIQKGPKCFSDIFPYEGIVVIKSEVNPVEDGGHRVFF